MPKPVSELRAAVIGAGRLGTLHARKYAAIAGIRLAHIVDIALIGDAQNVDARTLEGLGMIVQRVLDFIDDEVRHGAVDIAGQLDETGFDAGLLGFP